CRGCGVAARLHARRPVRVRDLPAAGRPVTLIWVKRVWRCAEAVCEADLDRDQRADPGAGVADRTGPGGGVPAGRRGRPRRRGGGGRVRRGLAEAADRARVVYMPDTAWPVSGLPPGSSRSFQNTPVSMSSEWVS